MSSESAVFKFVKHSRDIISVLTVLVGCIFGYVVLQTTVTAHTAKINELSSQFSEVSTRLDNKIEKQQEHTTDIEIRLARMDGKLDMILEKQGQAKK